MPSLLRICLCSIAWESTFKAGDLQHIYLKLQSEGLDTFLFSDGTIQSFSAFERGVTRPDVWFYAGYGEDGEPVAVVLLDQFKGKTAHIHFAFFRGEGMKHRHRIAFRFLSLLFTGGLTAIFGGTSIRWRNVRNFAREAGFVELARIPGYHAWLNRRTGEMEYHDSMLSVCTPETLQLFTNNTKEA